MPKQHTCYRVLLVDDEEGILFTLGALLKKEGYLVESAASLAAARALLAENRYDLAFLDIMLGSESGIELLREIKATTPSTQVVMFTGFPQIESASEAVRLGAFDYIAKPIRFETMIAVTRHALSSKALLDERELNRANLAAIFRTVADSIVMVDSQGCLVQFNATAGKVCGYTQEYIGSEATNLHLGCRGACRSVMLDVLKTSQPRELRRAECCPVNGKPRIISLSASPVIELDGRINGVVAVIRDETQLVELERSLLERGRFHKMVGASKPMQRIYSLIDSLVDMPTTVLINGESGTGKELVAAALHYGGVRAKAPFVKVNCSALSEALLESELFGHVRGAFTGAVVDKTGRFQKAHGGTLFLDEIGDISSAVQMRLLRVLQESEFERVGDATPIKVDVRIIAATNQSLAEKVSQGTFRSDLYYRLNVVRMELPPLRDRLDDLELLVADFIAHYNTKLNKQIMGISDDVMALFRAYRWPGNVRELEHAVEHAVVLCKSSIIAVSDLPLDILDTVPAEVYSASKQFEPVLVTNAKMTLADALAAAEGNKAHAARLLGISRMTLYRQLTVLGEDAAHG
jgi:PAS domain S-box-containing protein